MSGQRRAGEHLACLAPCADLQEFPAENILERLGYRADVVSNGLQVLSALERATYDVVLMDVQMPELDGFEASREINRRWPGERNNPFYQVAFAPRGDLLAVGVADFTPPGGRDFSIELRDTDTGTVRQRLVGPQRAVVAILYEVEPLDRRTAVVVQSELVANEEIPVSESAPRAADNCRKKWLGVDLP